jgi:hypothetical protein
MLRSARAKEAGEKSLLRIESGPQRLKPDLFSISYVRAEARTLQQQSFSAACKARPFLGRLRPD